MSHIDDKTAGIFAVQHLSLYDGPGIRTTVFFKGCPLRCKWCHNPESFCRESQLSYNPVLCSRCGKCCEVCPTGAHKFVEQNGEKVHILNHELCIRCGRCTEVCCYGALEIIGEEYTPEQLFENIKHDIPYYSINKSINDGGGITLSGGEPMLQVDFIIEFLKLCRGIHISIETCGYALPEEFIRIAPMIDLFLFDYKATDPDKHLNFCGTDNELILENLNLLYKMGSNIILRLPLIPGVNDDNDHFSGIAAILEKYPDIKMVEVMVYHDMGNSKAENTGMEILLDNVAISEDIGLKWIDKLKELGVKQQIRIG